jgi:hypothetical protein
MALTSALTGRPAQRAGLGRGARSAYLLGTVMTEFLAPGVYIEEVPTGVHPIEGVPTSRAGFIGVSADPQFFPIVTSFAEFMRMLPTGGSAYLSSAVLGFFLNGGQRCSVALIGATDPFVAALDTLAGEAVSILCCPDEHVFPNAASAMVEHCELHKDRVCILQSPQPTVPAATHQPPVLYS